MSRCLILNQKDLILSTFFPMNWSVKKRLANQVARLFAVYYIITLEITIMIIPIRKIN